VDVRQGASTWSTIVKPQTSWTNYVFGEDPLFPKDRRLVLFSPPSDDTEAYLDHARLIVPDPPLVCLADAQTTRAAATLAGASVLDAADVSPDAARAACGLKLTTVAVTDEVAEFGASDEPTFVALIGPDHDDAALLYRRTLAVVLDADCDTDDALEDLVRDTLTSDDVALLANHTIYICRHGPLFPLASTGDGSSRSEPDAG